jgi:hypothetical protein
MITWVFAFLARLGSVEQEKIPGVIMIVIGELNPRT